MSQDVKGTFTCTEGSLPGQISAALLIHNGTTIMFLTLGGSIGASDTVKTQKSTDMGASWSDVTTYNSAQDHVQISVTEGDRWRLVQVTQESGKDITYALSQQSA